MSNNWKVDVPNNRVLFECTFYNYTLEGNSTENYEYVLNSIMRYAENIMLGLKQNNIEYRSIEIWSPIQSYEHYGLVGGFSVKMDEKNLTIFTLKNGYGNRILG